MCVICCVSHLLHAKDSQALNSVWAVLASHEERFTKVFKYPVHLRRFLKKKIILLVPDGSDFLWFLFNLCVFSVALEVVAQIYIYILGSLLMCGCLFYLIDKDPVSAWY